jgi:hypothetical protein
MTFVNNGNGNGSGSADEIQQLREELKKAQMAKVVEVRKLQRTTQRSRLSKLALEYAEIAIDVEVEDAEETIEDSPDV